MYACHSLEKQKMCHSRGCVHRVSHGWELDGVLASCAAHAQQGMVQMRGIPCEFPCCRGAPVPATPQVEQHTRVVLLMVRSRDGSAHAHTTPPPHTQPLTALDCWRSLILTSEFVFPDRNLKRDWSARSLAISFPPLPPLSNKRGLFFHAPFLPSPSSPEIRSGRPREQGEALGRRCKAHATSPFLAEAVVDDTTGRSGEKVWCASTASLWWNEHGLGVRRGSLMVCISGARAGSGSLSCSGRDCGCGLCLRLLCSCSAPSLAPSSFLHLPSRVPCIGSRRNRVACTHSSSQRIPSFWGSDIRRH